MTVEEAKAKIRELEDFIIKEENKFGFKDDGIFLLSVDEYQRYKKEIDIYCTKVRCPWWLRSPGVNIALAAYVSRDGSVDRTGLSVINDCVCVRPAIKMGHNKYIRLGGIIDVYSKDKTLPFVKISENNEYDLFLADIPIAWYKFDAYSNDYEKSYIRRNLKPLR